ncbi:hypothetical protein HPB50_008115 [Hyalomma asiaticum]|uniref:Uncharacterized protein n=1 Tax=Hyalomma asiaticum TaxID=266040 RepID=A0ACB7S824_HYAAI|nr:hypothetical protein HPB50_008115 [Hyalomma asiaticum]
MCGRQVLFAAVLYSARCVSGPAMKKRRRQGQVKGPDPLAGDEPAKLFDANVPLEEKQRVVFEYYRRLVDDYDRLRHPTGQKDAPARTCRDLAALHPKLQDGLYWIDPNEGNARDAVQVHCRMAAGASCVLPSPNKP